MTRVWKSWAVDSVASEVGSISSLYNRRRTTLTSKPALRPVSSKEFSVKINRKCRCFCCGSFRWIWERTRRVVQFKWFETSILSPLIVFVQRVSFCETLDSVSEYRPELVLKVVFFPFSPEGGERGWLFQGFSRSENTEMILEILFLNAGCQDPHPYFF